MNDSRAVTIIVPTRALPERRALVLRALDSLLAQDGVRGVRVVPLVVVNGSGGDPDLLRALGSDKSLRLRVCTRTGLPAALDFGRRAVDTPWFTDLDDDDLLLPGALAQRVEALERRPDCCSVVTNGLRRSAAGDVLHVPDDLDVESDPLGSLLSCNWLLPGSYLCRTEAVGTDVFAQVTPHLERTYLAIRLAMLGPLCWLREPTVVYFEGSPGSQWASETSILGQSDALHEILRLELPAEFRARLRARVSEACHAASEYERGRGALRAAWRWHLKSLVEPHGWRYLPYTLRLLGRPPTGP